jgi:hypothetical protein
MLAGYLAAAARMRLKGARMSEEVEAWRFSQSMSKSKPAKKDASRVRARSISSNSFINQLNQGLISAFQRRGVTPRPCSRTRTACAEALPTQHLRRPTHT